MSKPKITSAEVTITMVPHGYQLDVDVWAKTKPKAKERRVRVHSGCRDFSGVLKTGQDWSKAFLAIQNALNKITRNAG